MSFLDLNLDDVQEFKTVPEGEYKLRILKSEVKTSQNTGGQYLSVLLDIPEEPLSKNISHIMMFPTASDDVKQTNNRKLAIVNFLKAFGFDPSNQIDLDSMEGALGWAIVAEKDDPEYGLQNRIKKFVIPK